MIRKRTRQPDVAEADPLEDQAPEVAALDEPELLEGDATAEEIADTVLRHRQLAEAHAEAAERDQAEHDDLTAQFEADIAALRAKYETKAQPIAGSKAEHLRRGDGIAETIHRLGNAEQLAAKAEVDEAKRQVLEDERAGLLDRRDELSGLLEQRAADRGVLEAQLATATEAADSAEMTRLRGELESTRSIEANLRAKLTDVQAGLDKLGDGELLPVWPQKLLYEARRNADAGRHQARSALNWALPDRQEAVADRERQHERELDRLDSEQRAAERAAEDKRQARRQIVARH